MRLGNHARRIRPLVALTVLAATAAMAAPPGGKLSRVLDVSSEAAQEEVVPPSPSRQAPTWSANDIAPTPMEPQAAEPQAADDGFVTYSDGGCGDDCCDDCCGCDDMWACNRCGLFFGGGDYLYTRTHFSQATAAVVQSQTVVQTDNGTTNISQEREVPFHFRYQNDYRAFVGYRLLSCGGDVQFTYWNLKGGSSVTEGPALIESGQRLIFGQLQNNPGEGQFLTATQNVNAKVYDLDFMKCLSLGGPMSPCDPCGCPRWDIRWLGGVRVGDVRRSDNNVVFNEGSTSGISEGFIQANFTGVGPHVGMQGRRYVGPHSRLSFYTKATGALLIGNLHMDRTLVTPGSDPTPTQILDTTDKFSRVIPVTDIEVGATWQVACRAFVSAGWFWQAWWDLGASENICPNQLNFCSSLNTSNILGFDGLFVRGEFTF